MESTPVKILLLAAGLALAAPVFASQELAQKNACLACHAVDKKMVGPAYQDVAKKYAGQKDAEAALASSIKAGGSGKWGPVPMPARAALGDADAQKLAAWIPCASEMCAGELAAEVHMPQSTVSQHLSLMFRAGLLARREERQQAHYRVEPKTRGFLCRAVRALVA